MPFLDWVNKKQAQRADDGIPYHLLEFQSAYGDPDAENLLIQGDNLLALKALLPFYRGRVKCIFIDPPYNTKSAFTHYDDNLEHSQWLTMMYPRLVLLRELLAENGSMWITIDDNEAHYLKVLCDEVFGRQNFVCNCIWQKKFSPQNDEKLITASHDHLLVVAKNKSVCTFNQLQRTDAHDNSFSNPDNDSRGAWSSGDMTSKTKAAEHSYPVVSPAGVTHYPPPGRQWAPSLTTFNRWLAENRIWFGKDGANKPRVKQFLSEVQGGIVPLSIWLREDVGDNQDAKREVKIFNNIEIFDTPKPEKLVQKVLHLASNPGDLIIDSFAGSGTTAAVAHKMGRRYIGIEMGEHARSHCLPRLEKVIAGEQGGISKPVNWQGGGGFRFYTLGDQVFDADGGIHPSVRFPALAAYLWHFETGQAAAKRFDRPLLGIHEGTAYYLLYNGILGDRRPQGGNVLTSAVLTHLQIEFPHAGPRVIYGEATRLSIARLRSAGVSFRQMPYDIRVR